MGIHYLNSERTKRLFDVVLVLFSIFIIVSYTLSLTSARMSLDAGYYLRVVREMVNGGTMYRDFEMGYTPLSFYIVFIPCKILGRVSYLLPLSIFYIFIFVSGYFVYKTCYKETGSVRFSWLGMLIMLLIYLIFDGREYCLEPFMVSFGLAGMYMLFKDTKRNHLIAGFFCFCSFWCKQYGLGFILLAMVFVMFREGINKCCFNKHNLKNLSWLMLGFFAGAVIFITILLIQGVNLNDLVRLGGADYERTGDFKGMIESYALLFLDFSILPIAIVACIVYFKKTINNVLLIVSLCGILGFMYTTHIRTYMHYMMPAVPFAIFLALASLKIIDTKMRNLYVLLLCLCLLIPLFTVSKKNLRILQYQPRYSQQWVAQRVLGTIPTGTKNVFATPKMMPISLMNDYTSMYIEKYGFTDGMTLKPDVLIDMISGANYCLIHEKDLDDRYNTELRQYIDDHFEREIVVSPDNNTSYICKRID